MFVLGSNNSATIKPFVLLDSPPIKKIFSFDSNIATGADFLLLKNLVV